MAIPKPQPADWQKANAQQLKLGDAEVLKMLREAYTEVNKTLKSLKPSADPTIRRIQLQQTRIELLNRQAEIFERLGDLTSARRTRAVARSQRLSAADTAFLLGRVGEGAAGEALYKAALGVSERAIEASLTRMRLSEVPLSQKIYRTKTWMAGRLNRLINSTLAQGLNAAEFAKKARDWFNPNTPGGVRYAALRLARTEINNAFHASTVERAAAKPWVTKMDWNLSKSHPGKDICNLVADGSPYAPTDVPVRPHPQCMCYVTEAELDEDDWIDGFIEGKYDDYLDGELEKAGVPRESAPTSVPEPVRIPEVSFEDRLAAAATGAAALAAPLLGRDRAAGSKTYKAPMDLEMKRAVRQYTGEWYRDVNGFLRGRPVREPEDQETVSQIITDLDRAIDESPLQEDAVVFRGMRSGSGVFGDRLSGDVTGMEWAEEAYVSTTAVEKKTRIFLGRGTGVLMRILLPKGTKAIEASPLNNEAEVLLGRGSRLRVVKDNGTDVNGLRLLDVEVF